MQEQPGTPAGSPSAVAELKGVIAQYEELRDAAHADAAAVISAGSRLRAIIVAKQVISTEPSELMEAAYAEVTHILAIVSALAGSLADFETTA
jgi:hypothetical protein